MITLIIGGSASGKSEYAERLVLTRPGPHIYLATMEPWGEEGAARIEKHRRARSKRDFLTVERYTALDKLAIPPASIVLLEDLGNLTANEMFHPDGGGEEAVRSGLVHLIQSSADLTVVTNDVFTGGKLYEGDTLLYLKSLAALNRWLAAQADSVIEVICGLPEVWKGALL